MKRPAFILLLLFLFALSAPGAALSSDLTPEDDIEVDPDLPPILLPPAPPIPLDIPIDSIAPSDPVGYLGGSSAVDMNAVETRRWFDGFGRLRRERRDGAGEIEVAHEERASNGHVVGVVERITSDDGGEYVTEYDELGRVVEEAVRGFDGAWSVRAVGFDPLGRVASVQRPSFGGPGPATQIEHDSLDRVLEVIGPDGATTRWSHTMFETRSWDPRGNEHVIRRDADDRVVESGDWIDGQEETTRYGYGPFDLIEEVEDAEHNITSIGYDRLGRKIWLNDPDRGLADYKYNGLGELRQETDALGDVKTYSRDTIGRIEQQVDADGTTTFTWDQGPNAAGQLSTAVSPDGTVTALHYDSLGRLEEAVTTVDGQPYEVGRSYDALGRLSALRYPDVPGRAGFVVEHHYNAWGYLEVYKDGWVGGQKVSLHYFQSDSGKVFGFKIKEGWSNVRR